MLECLVRRSYDAAALFVDHPPKLRHLHKRMVLDAIVPRGTTLAGRIELTRWKAAALPAACTLAATACTPRPGYFDYAGDQRGVWHVNFADPNLFFAYGSALLAQDELQAAEHPALGPIREALLAEGQPARTEEEGLPTPVLVAGVERRCEIVTAPTASRPGGLYGNRFASAALDDVRDAIRVISPPTLSNLIAIAAPGGGTGTYSRDDLEQVLVTAYTGFAAAALESRAMWPGTPVEVRTGFWGCGAFGGNRHAMTLLQLLAARLAGLDRLTFYVFDDAGLAAYRTGAADLEAVVAPGGSLAEVLARVEDRRYPWGVSDGT
jgi:hypothetical protein